MVNIVEQAFERGCGRELAASNPWDIWQRCNGKRVETRAVFLYTDSFASVGRGSCGVQGTIRVEVVRRELMDRSRFLMPAWFPMRIAEQAFGTSTAVVRGLGLMIAATDLSPIRIFPN